MQKSLIVMTVLGLAACSPPIPDSGQPYSGLPSYQAEREATLQGLQVDTTRISDEPLDSTYSVDAYEDETGALASDVIDALGVDSSETATASATISRDGSISDEQSFDAVTSRETIESDAERIRRNAEAYQQAEVTALPTRPTDTGVSIVSYALQTTNAVGEQIYKRGRFNEARFAKNCLLYESPDLAQEAFLENGGPVKDRKGMDPDGDGFACGWNPTPFRNVSVQ